MKYHIPAGRDAVPAESERLGFTLIEVLISVVILATGIVVVLQAFNVSLVVLGESRNVMKANMLIMEKMAEIELSALRNGEIDAETSRGTFGEESGDYCWESKVTSLSGSGNSVLDGGKLNQIDITVWRERSTRRYSASTLLKTGKVGENVQ